MPSYRNIAARYREKRAAGRWFQPILNNLWQRTGSRPAVRFGRKFLTGVGPGAAIGAAGGFIMPEDRYSANGNRLPPSIRDRLSGALSGAMWGGVLGGLGGAYALK